MSDQHLRRLCWGMCIFCVLALGFCLRCVVSHESMPGVDTAFMGVGGIAALAGFWVFFSIAHEEQSR